MTLTWPEHEDPPQKGRITEEVTEGKEDERPAQKHRSLSYICGEAECIKLAISYEDGRLISASWGKKKPIEMQ